MLILGRRINESIIIRTPGGEVIEILAKKIDGSHVTLGITAPATVTVDREEIDELKQMEGKAHDD